MHARFSFPKHNNVFSVIAKVILHIDEKSLLIDIQINWSTNEEITPESNQSQYNYTCMPYSFWLIFLFFFWASNVFLPPWRL